MSRKSGISTELIALAAEARRRGITYGQLVAGTTSEERWEIIRRYQESRGHRKKEIRDPLNGSAV